MGRVYQAAQLWTEAIQLLRNAAALLPDDLSILRELAASLLDANAQEEAATHLTRLSAAWPSRADIHVLLASAHLDAGDADSAIGGLASAASIDPKRFGARALLRSASGDLTVGSIEEPAAYCQRIGIALSRPGNSAGPDGYFVCPLRHARTVGDHFMVATDDDAPLPDGMV